MKKLLLGLLFLTGAVIAVLGYERLFVEKYIGPAALFGFLILGFFFIVVLLTYRLYETKHRETMSRIWLVGLSTVTAYFVLDIAAGFLFIKPLSPPLVPDEYLHHRLVPNSHARLHQAEFSYIQRVNNLGMRGADIPVEKPVGHYRIAMLGDSFTMGKGVEDDQTFSILVERALNERLAMTPTCGLKSIDVLNAGVDSYAPILQLIQMKRELAPLELDMVVLNLDLSDLIQEAAYRSQAARSPAGEITGIPNTGSRESVTERLRNSIDRRLFFTRALLFYVSEFFGYRDLSVRTAVTQAGHRMVAYTLEHDIENRDEQWRNLFDSILKIKQYSDSMGIKFVLSIYPWAHQISDTEWIPGRYSVGIKDDTVVSKRRETIIKAFAEQNGIPVADAFPTFRAYKGPESLYFNLDPHWTTAGQRVMAKSLSEFLEGSYFANWCE